MKDQIKEQNLVFMKMLNGWFLHEYFDKESFGSLKTKKTVAEIVNFSYDKEHFDLIIYF